MITTAATTEGLVKAFAELEARTAQNNADQVDIMLELRNRGLSNVKIAAKLGFRSENSVRARLRNTQPKP